MRLSLLIASLALAWHATPCTTVMCGKKATPDGSVLMSHSCDGDIMGVMTLMPAVNRPPGTKVPMYRNMPRPRNYDEYVANVRKGYDIVGHLTLGSTYRTILFGGHLESMTTGGINEHGLTVAIEFIPMRTGLACSRGAVGPNSNHWSTSLIANALMRAKTAREAIRVIGSMVEEYGFQYYRNPNAGVALPIADKNEVWLMEIFGPGPDWKPESGKPGGVWCAQRIPDGEVAVTANRSRIGKIDLSRTDEFMASPNVFSLSEELGFRKPGDPFIWHDAYGDPGSRGVCLREWRALSLAATGLDLKATGDPLRDRYPFSVPRGQPFTVERLFALMRDAYQGTEFDITEHPAFRAGAKKSPLARPWGPPELFDLLKIKPERAIATPTSGYVFVSQLRSWLPDPVAHCLWFAYGPADTSCSTPVYSGVTNLPEDWSRPADFTRITRGQPQWEFRLVNTLTNSLNYQSAIRDVRAVIEPAEKRFLAFQPAFEEAAVSLLRKRGAAATARFLNEYVAANMRQIGYSYRELADYLMFRYLAGAPEVAPPKLPRIAAPEMPAARPETTVAIVVGPSTHPPGTHEVKAGGRLLAWALENMKNVSGVRARVFFEEWPRDRTVLDDVDAVVFIGDLFPPHRMEDSATILEDLAAIMRRGAGIVCLHHANGVPAENAPPNGAHPLLEWMGGYFAPRNRHHRSVARVFDSVTVSPAGPGHPVSAGWRTFTVADEPYYKNYFGPDGNRPAPNVTILATAQVPPEDPKTEAVAWGVERKDGGRGFGVVMPHFYKNWADENLRRLILNGVVWAAGREVPATGVETPPPDLHAFGAAGIEPRPRRTETKK
jgi:dipeptidase/type 1 glutamine amidotransferase